MYRLSDYDYYLPPELIAQQPAKPRDHSRLLVFRRKKKELLDRHFYDLPDFLRAGDVLVVNDSKVFPARLSGIKESGGKMEVFLHRHLAGKDWECLIKGKAKTGMKIVISKKLEAYLISPSAGGTWIVRFSLGGADFMKEIGRVGQVPLPPYIHRENSDSQDKLRYQTVYAASGKDGSAAAPTAGLHFTKRLLEEIKKKGVKIVPVTLHVGLGTFRPVKSADIRQHEIHQEWISVSKRALKEIVAAKNEGRRIIGVGTTSVRTLESVAPSLEIRKGKYVTPEQAFSAWTGIFIYPGYRFHLVDAMVTNFHLPKSSLLMLVSAFAGRKAVLEAYKEAVARGYRFFSYGDAMFIE